MQWACLMQKPTQIILENENETFFVELWHVCDTKSCVKKFGGGKINEIYAGTISYADMLLIQCHIA